MNKGFGVAKKPEKKKKPKGSGAAGGNAKLDKFNYTGGIRPGIQSPRREVGDIWPSLCTR